MEPGVAVTQRRGAVREHEPLAAASEAWPMQNAALYTLIWVVIWDLRALSVRLYKRSVTGPSR